MQIGVAPWQWNTDDPDMPYWDAPEADKCIGRLDLRSFPECGQYGGTPAKRGGIFPYNTAPALLNTLDTSVGIPLAKRIDLRKTWEIPGDVSLSPANPIDFIVWIFNTQADPTGQNRWKPLRGSRRNPPSLYLAGKEVWEGRLTGDSQFSNAVLDNTIAVFKADYARLKSEGVPIEHLRKVTGAKMLSLWGRMGDDVLEPLLGPNASDGWGVPSSEIIDTFVEAGDTALASHDPTPTDWGGWTIIDGGFTVIAATDDVDSTDAGASIARADYAMSSDGHYSQIDMFQAGFDGGGTTRKDNTATITLYYTSARDTNNDISHYKIVTGGYTQLDKTSGLTIADGDTIYYEVTEGDLHTIKQNGTTRVGPNFDNSITGNVYAGLFAYGTSTTMGSFVGGDFGVAAAVGGGLLNSLKLRRLKMVGGHQ
jgi:hypothetical protein